jgi:hypothetical protein
LAHLRLNKDLRANAGEERDADGNLVESDWADLTPDLIDMLVATAHSKRDLTLIKVEPWTSLVMGMLTPHAGAKGRMGSNGASLPDYRYHR